MKVGLLIIAHHPLGDAVLQTAVETLGRAPMPVRVLPVSRDEDRDRSMQRARELAAELDQDDGLLVLTDIYGSTPSNIACSLQENSGVRVVAGLNLPMLIRVFNYADLDLDSLAEKALSGGHDGVLACCDVAQSEKSNHA